MGFSIGELIQVTVEATLPGLIIVSYNIPLTLPALGYDTYRGALIHDNRNTPPGVSSLLRNIHTDERLYSVSKRHTYEAGPEPLPVLSRAKKRTKMTVRLRPRKVLCSNCQGICNENEENVTHGKKRTSERNTPTNKRIYLSSDRKKREDEECPPSAKLTRSRQAEAEPFARNEVWLKSDDKIVTDEFSINKSKLSDDGELSDDSCDRSDNLYSFSERNSENRFISSDKKEGVDGETRGRKSKNRPTRKSDEETSLKKRKTENSSPTFDDDSGNLPFPNARTLKISFGEGEETVLKLPMRIDDPNPLVEADTKTKAVKKALKKAKKQARKQASSPTVIDSPPNEADVPFQTFPKRHKHKVKHKKKHKDDKKPKVADGLSDSDPPSGEENYSAIKERCLKQKLSISLKRLNENNYEKNDDLDIFKNGSNSSDTDSENWDDNAPAEVNIVPGDVVWGKLQGFSWWPGRVLALRCGGQAHVAWYASTTSSMMPQHRLNPFLDSFKIRFNKKKKGSYKEAVRLASVAAKSVDPLATDPLATPSNNITPLSPTPIDVLS